MHSTFEAVKSIADDFDKGMCRRISVKGMCIRIAVTDVCTPWKTKNFMIKDFLMKRRTFRVVCFSLIFQDRQKEREKEILSKHANDDTAYPSRDTAGVISKNGS